MHGGTWSRRLARRPLFGNLAVRDLKKSMGFFSNLGFEFNPKFTDEKAACMVVSDEAFVALRRSDQWP